jgi:hypothetical protein
MALAAATFCRVLRRGEAEVRARREDRREVVDVNFILIVCESGTCENGTRRYHMMLWK